MTSYSVSFLTLIESTAAKKRFCRSSGLGWRLEEDIRFHLGGQLHDWLGNEAPWIISALQSVSTHIDSFWICDAGAGWGSPAAAIAREALGRGLFVSVVLLEIDRDLIKVSKERFREHGLAANYVLGDAENLPFREAAFRCVLNCEVLEHLGNPARAVVELCRVLDSEGLLYLETPNRLFPLDCHDTKLPFLRLLPDRVATFIAGVLGRTDETFMRRHGAQVELNHILTWGEIFPLVKGSLGQIAIRNRDLELLISTRPSRPLKFYLSILRFAGRFVGPHINWVTPRIAVAMTRSHTEHVNPRRIASQGIIHE